jgi:hypothetical protein
VTPAGEYVFLEINQMGQFLWLEELLPELPLLDAFCELLLQRRADFEWSANRATVRFAELHDPAREASIDALHMPHPQLYLLDDDGTGSGIAAA